MMTPLIATLNVAWGDVVQSLGVAFAVAAMAQAVFSLRAAYQSKRADEKLAQLRVRYNDIEFLIEHVDTLEAEQIARLLASAQDSDRARELERLRATPRNSPSADEPR